jgi:hypothetical protein
MGFGPLAGQWDLAAWWKIRKQQGSAFAAMMWAIFLLVTAQSVVSFTVVANLPS